MGIQGTIDSLRRDGNGSGDSGRSGSNPFERVGRGSGPVDPLPFWDSVLAVAVILEIVVWSVRNH